MMYAVSTPSRWTLSPLVFLEEIKNFCRLMRAFISPEDTPCYHSGYQFFLQTDSVTVVANEYIVYPVSVGYLFFFSACTHIFSFKKLVSECTHRQASPCFFLHICSVIIFLLAYLINEVLDFFHPRFPFPQQQLIWILALLKVGLHYIKVVVPQSVRLNI